MSEIRIEPSQLTFASQQGDTLLRAALRAGVAWPYECNTGACGTCKFELLAGHVDVLRESPPGLSERDRRKGRYLACQCRAASDCEIKVHIDVAEPVRFRPERIAATLVARREVTHDIEEFVFAANRPAAFLPGQYALLGLPDAAGTVRAYSMSNLPNESGMWHFQVRQVPGGLGSGALFAMPIGTEATLDGPYGHAYLREDSERDIVCIAGGSGLAPMLSIARATAASPRLAHRRVHFFYGGRQARDICGEDMLQALPEFGRRLTYHPVVSQPEGADDGWRGAVGWVHDLVGSTLTESLDRYEYYLAGPPPMVAAVLDLLQTKHRVANTQIHFDRFL